jgi:Zn-dependent protease/predicted transcriptional regulator
MSNGQRVIRRSPGAASVIRGAWRVGKIAGIEIRIHYTWLFAFLLITWSLAAGFFPQNFPHWSIATYWITGVLASILLFISVLLHELAHSLVGRARGLQINSITLFIFGGASNLESEPEEPWDEFTMTIVGPATSVVIAVVSWVLYLAMSSRTSPVAATLFYIAIINGLLAAFNLLPGFPLDGGRVLRSILWKTTGDVKKATNIAATVGQVFAFILIAVGILQFLLGNFLGGLWITFIGWFLNGAAESSRGQITLREHLRGVKVAEIVDTTPETIGPGMTVNDLVRSHFLQNGHRSALVVDEGQLRGIVTLTDVRKLPHENWGDTTIDRIMTPMPLQTVRSDEDLAAALKMLARNNLKQVPVMDDGVLKGLLTTGDIIRYLEVSQELHLGGKMKTPA